MPARRCGSAGGVTGPALYAKALYAKASGDVEALMHLFEQTASKPPASMLAIGPMSGTSQDGGRRRAGR
jgi:hypothetical protein